MEIIKIQTILGTPKINRDNIKLEIYQHLGLLDFESLESASTAKVDADNIIGVTFFQEEHTYFHEIVLFHEKFHRSSKYVLQFQCFMNILSKFVFFEKATKFDEISILLLANKFVFFVSCYSFEHQSGSHYWNFIK